MNRSCFDRAVRTRPAAGEVACFEHNHLLAALSAEVRERVFPHLHLVSLPLGQVVYESGDALQHVYFPTDAIVSLLYVMENGASAEISVVGNDGLVGVAVFMGGQTALNRAVVQSAGSAFRLAAHRLKAEFDRHGDLLAWCCATPRPSSRRCRRRRSAIGITRSNSSCAGGCCSRWIDCTPTN